jgi:CubicO group peptidase (beta-lactamase class C family)
MDDRVIHHPSAADMLLRRGVDSRAFPGASVCVAAKDRLLGSGAVGRFEYSSQSPEGTSATSFDLASLTKVMATTTAAMLLFERGKMRLDEPVVNVVPEFRGEDHRREAVTYRMLLAHSSGLPGHRRFFETARDRESLLNLIYATPLEATPGSRVEYSDIGFIILGVALERIAGESLDAFCKREIFEPLGMTRTEFCPPARSRDSIPPTVDDKKFRKKIIQGEVNDENAWVMGGVAGHAGLFASAEDVAKFAQCMLRGGAPILKPETVKLFTKRQQSPAGTTRTLGWDTPSVPSQSGKYFSPASFGHLGYTGTSLWIDPQRELAIVLLTNRTWPDNSSQAIKQVRPAVHDAIIEAIDSGESVAKK